MPELGTRFGVLLLAAAAVGEFGPIVMMSLLLAHDYTHSTQAALLLSFVVVAFAAAFLALRVRPPRVVQLLGRTPHASSQLPVRLCMLFLTFFIVLAQHFGLDAIMGAFAAGMVVGLATRGKEGAPVREKLDAIAFGYFVPFFFVTSGITFDLGALLHGTRSLLLVPLFLALFVVVRGVPVVLYRRDLAREARLPFVLYTATTLPLLVAMTDIGVHTGRMNSDVAAALVGAGMLSVLLFPPARGRHAPHATPRSNARGRRLDALTRARVCRGASNSEAHHPAWRPSTRPPGRTGNRMVVGPGICDTRGR